MKKIEIYPEKIDKVLNVVSRQVSEINYAYAGKLLRQKDIRVNDVKISENVVVNPSHKISVFMPEDKKTKHYEVVFEDDYIVVVNKKKGIECDGPESLEAEIGGVFAVHRLDRNTEGLVIYSKKADLLDDFKEMFINEGIEKYYLAEIIGSFERDFIASGYIFKDSTSGQSYVYQSQVKGGLPIKTGVKTLKRGNVTSIVEVRLYTGRTHQIRAHLAYLGHPILGDGKYGKLDKRFKDKTQKLFCYKLVLKEPNGKIEYLKGKVFECMPDFYKK